MAVFATLDIPYFECNLLMRDFESRRKIALKNQKLPSADHRAFVPSFALDATPLPHIFHEMEDQHSQTYNFLCDSMK